MMMAALHHGKQQHSSQCSSSPLNPSFTLHPLLLCNAFHHNLYSDVVITALEPFLSQLKTIKKSIKDFSLDRFEAGSCNAFRAVVQAFAQGNIERLEQLVGPKVLKGFQSAIKARTKQKETMNIDIKNVEVELEDIILVKTIAQILVRFTSDQVVTTTNKAGEIIDNTNLITNRMIDRWTFEKDLKESGPIWLLVKTESLA